MPHQFSKIMFTDGVKATQSDFGSRKKQERFTELANPNDRLGEAEAGFIAARDTFYMATVNEAGWPYVQHRGGPVGFLRVLGDRQLAYADFRGNTQLVSMGNSRGNNRVSLILMDYPNRRRLKVLGHLWYEHADMASGESLEAVALPGYRARIERIVHIDVEAFDWNCPQHIARRYTRQEFEVLVHSDPNNLG